MTCLENHMTNYEPKRFSIIRLVGATAKLLPHVIMFQSKVVGEVSGYIGYN